MKPGPSLARKVLPEFISITSEPLPAVEWLTYICIAQSWFSSGAEAREAAERWEDRFLSLLRDEVSELNRLGRFSQYSFNSSSEYMLQGACFVEPRDPDDVKEAKTRRAQFSDYTSVLSELTPEEFEAMCVGILELIGVKDPQLTSYSTDEGIDFYGRLQLEEHILLEDRFPSVQRQLSAWMVGQAKHYKLSQVSTFDIRELVGSVELAKGRAYSSVNSKYPDLEIRVCDPVFYLFFTTGRISSDSWRLVDHSGVVGMDGEMVAAFLADRGVGTTNEGFDNSLLSDWLAQYQ